MAFSKKILLDTTPELAANSAISLRRAKAAGPARPNVSWLSGTSRIIVYFARVYRVRAWFGFVRSALLLAVVKCIVLSCQAMPCLCCFLRVTSKPMHLPSDKQQQGPCRHSRVTLVRFFFAFDCRAHQAHFLPRGYMGKEAVKFVNRLGDIAGESGRIPKGAFVRWAMQLLSVLVQRGNAEIVRRSGLVISREQGLRYDAGVAVPVLMS